jgi:hypothetical protein
VRYSGSPETDSSLNNAVLNGWQSHAVIRHLCGPSLLKHRNK